jgi:hypothetical protein
MEGRVNLNHHVTAINVLLEKAIKAEGKTFTVPHAGHQQRVLRTTSF